MVTHLVNRLLRAHDGGYPLIQIIRLRSRTAKGGRYRGSLLDVTLDVTTHVHDWPHVGLAKAGGGWASPPTYIAIGLGLGLGLE